MVNRLLYLEPGHLRRAWPFFALYLVLFAALTLADGLSLALFVARVGADRLPLFQALSAVCVMFVVGWYLLFADRCGTDRVFVGILLGPLVLFAVIWAGLSTSVLAGGGLGILFLGRELAFALVLLHFGAYLQEYFTREELNRVMPVVYAGGRLGGIAGGAALEHLSRLVEPVDLLLLLAALLAVAILGVKLIQRCATTVDEPADPPQSAAHQRGGAAPAARPAREPHDTTSPETARGFLTFVWRSPLLFWITASTLALFFCRTGLTLQCGRAFEREFAGDAELAGFLGRYSQIALAVSLPFQLFVVSRLVARIGLRGAQLTYALLVAAAALGGWGEMSLAAAVFARFVESELRYGLRNPLAQMTVNLFPKTLRTRARAWSLGVLIPLATLVAALVFSRLVGAQLFTALAIVTLAAAVAYVLATLALGTTIAEPRGRRVAFGTGPARNAAARIGRVGGKKSLESRPVAFAREPG